MCVETKTQLVSKTPRLGFLGVGWIGRNRMESIAKSGFGEVVAIAEPSAQMAEAAVCSLHKLGRPVPAVFTSLGELIEMGLDGIVIATPSALHAEQSIVCLERGVAVFCQKPLARTAEEAREVVEAARTNDCLLSVDLSYRHLAGTIRDLIRGGSLGKVFAVELAFHNAYGPDKAWFYDKRLSGGGCVMDLGIHLVDLALWALDFPAVEEVHSRLYQQGELWREGVEDYAAARLILSNESVLQLSCSWKLPVGCDAIISSAFYGTQGGARLKNINGSFYEFTVERCKGTKRSTLASSNGEWQAGAAVEWARRLADGTRYDREIEHVIEVAQALDQIYRSEQIPVFA
jgi:predicted dehydrogenase